MKRRSFVQASMALGSMGAFGSMLGCASVGRVPEKARVIVVGGGYGGATAAKYVRMLSNYKIDVTMIEPNGDFVSCPISNLVLGGSNSCIRVLSAARASSVNVVMLAATLGPPKIVVQ